MADLKISDLAPILEGAVANNDELTLRDLDDFSMGPTGTNKRLTMDAVLNAIIQAALDAHIVDNTNPHAVTAAQAGADPAGTGAAEAAVVQSNLDAHTVTADIHRSLNDGAITPTNLWSANKINTEIQAAAFDPAANIDFTGNCSFSKPITILEGALTATIGIDVANTALRINIPAGSGLTQVFISKQGGAATLSVDGSLIHQDDSQPGDT